MSDLVERLTMKADMIMLGEKIAYGSDSNIMHEAATALAKAQARIAELEGALKPFVVAADGLNDDTPDDAEVDYTDNLLIGDLRRARAALKGEG